MNFRKTASVAAWLSVVFAGTSAGDAAVPVDYEDGFVPHQVSLPRLAVQTAVKPDLAQSPWDKAVRLTGNLDWRRIRTADLPVQTYLFYDPEALWLGYRCEVKPGKDLKIEVKERDKELKRDDHFTFELDAGRTGRVFYRFVVNPAGALQDSVIIDKSWNSHAAIQTAVDDKGWTAIMRIPFSDFGGGEPAAGAIWSFNLATRSGYDNSWAPVLGGYHTPEQFARIVFTGRDMQPARIMEFKPLHIGANAFRVQAPAQARCLVEAVDNRGTMLARHNVAVGADGQVVFKLLDDRIDHVNFTLADADGKELLSFWRPAEIPKILGRLSALREKADVVRASLASFPQAARSDADRHCSEFIALASGAYDAAESKWPELNRKLLSLERQITDDWLYARTLAELSPKAGFAVAMASPMEKVMIKDFACPGTLAKQYDLYLARNEHEAVQLVVIPMTGSLKAVKVSASPVSGKAGQGELSGRITSSVVGHVKTVPGGSNLIDYVGWYPDPILDFQQSCEIARGDHVAFWVDVATDAKARPGDYESTIAISAEGCEPLQLKLNVHVWDIELPQGTHLRTAFTYTEQSTKRIYKDRWSDQMARRYYDFILDHRLNVDSLYGKKDLDVELLRYGVEKGMNAFNLFYVGKGADAGVVAKLLEERVPALKKAGVYSKAYLYGFDEVNDEVFPKIKDVFGRVHQLYPDLPRMTTGYDNTFGRTTGLRDYIDIWVPLIPEYNVLEAERLRAEGKDMWWYLCVGPRHPYPNWFVDSPTIETRLLMGAMSYKYQVGGVLYFMMNGWGLIEKPISAGPYTDWFPGSGKSRDGCYANGDGSVFCAGADGPVTTLRFENIRDGLEDYEYLYALAQTADAVGRKPATLERAAFLQDARELLAVPGDVVASSSRYTYDPQAVSRFRQAVANAIIRGRGQ